jgi:Rps23 Pro-64 3,4-dihydroxylase Tpa1-like proline 4-hydroxylase
MQNVTKYKNFLDDETYAELQNFVKNLIENRKNKLNMVSLAYGNSVNSNSIIRYGFEDDVVFKKKLQIEIESKIPYFVKNIHINLLPNLSFIDWHKDSHCIAALTLYINEKWEDNWGGYLIYEENDELKAIKPEKNLAIIQKTPLNHSVSIVNIGADYRVSLQLFLHKENEKNLI